MKYTDYALNILTAKTFKGIGAAWIVNNIIGKEKTSDIINILQNSTKEKYKITEDMFQNRKNLILSELEKRKDAIDGFVALGEESFPCCYGKVKPSEQPIVIFYKGNIDLLNGKEKCISVIGLLKPDEQIEQVERNVVTELIKQKCVIISGLALGCDTIAHTQALNMNGKTVAILPCSLKEIIPATNKKLASDILKRGGLLLGEYVKEHKTVFELNNRYKERDRLQALFSQGVILSASYAKNDQGLDSGSRLAMGYAFAYNIPRAVIYNSEKNGTDPKFNLSRQVMAEDKDVIVIDSCNLREGVQKILSKNIVAHKAMPEQLNLL